MSTMSKPSRAAAAGAVAAGLLLTAHPAAASDGSAMTPPEQLAAVELERPGAPPVAPTVRPPSPPTDNPGALPPPQPTAPYEMVPVPDRWRILDSITPPTSLFDPYHQNVLKGDKPVFDDWFVNLSAISDTIFEARSKPVPVGVATTEHTGQLDTFGRPNQLSAIENLILTLDVTKGDTTFKPPEYEFRFTPVINGNYTQVQERGLLNVDPTKGTVRRDNFVGIQDAFLDYHLGNVDDRFDFASIRGGVQPFQADFRGFLYQDNDAGARLFGNLFNNRVQYNFAWFKRIEKDTNSGLNDLYRPLRNDDVFVYNTYVQDFPVEGFTSQGVVLYNTNRETEFHYDKNGFLVRPASLGFEQPRRYSVTYLGYNGDGHIGWLNLTGSFYYVLGTDKINEFTGRSAKVRANFQALEPSVDFDWIRVRLSALHASGQKDPFSSTETGFDAVHENPLFAGGETSYWIRQSIPLIGGGGVALHGPNQVLPDLRSSGDEGQSNFNNPGVILLGAGADFDILPELRLSTNLNHLQFENTKVLEVLRAQDKIHKDIGVDLSAALTWRPLDTQNIVFRLSGAVLFAGQGFRDLYSTTTKTSRFYSILSSVVLAY